MKEWKRVFLSPRLLGLLGLLLLINLFLFYVEDHRGAEAFCVYNETLDRVRDMPFSSAKQYISRLEEERSAYSRLLWWAQAEEGPLKETFRERCAAYFGEDFEDHSQEIVEDEAPEVQEEAVSKLGQIYQLGRHRLMCGDSTDQETVRALIGGGGG